MDRASLFRGYASSPFFSLRKQSLLSSPSFRPPSTTVAFSMESSTPYELANFWLTEVEGKLVCTVGQTN